MFNKVAVATLSKKTLAQIFSNEFYENFKINFFIVHLRWLPLG